MAGIEAHHFGDTTIPWAIPNSYFKEMAQTLIEVADQMLYQVKQNGRSGIMVGNNLNWNNFKS